MKTNKAKAVILAAAFVLISGCDSQRLSQFSSFAAAGSLYVQEFHKVIQETGSAMIAVDSAVLVNGRNLAGEGNKDDVIKNDKLLETYLAILQKIDSHASALGSYFDAITQLTNGKASNDVSTAATDLLDSINNTFNPQIEKLSFGGKTIKDFVTEGSNLIVAHFEVKALNDHLKKAAPVIDRALALQEAAMEAIAVQMKASLNDSLKDRESTDVIQPYVQGPPPNWNADRESFLRTKVTITDVDNAKAAISKLHATFRELVQNPNATVDLATLLNEINKIAGFTSAIESSAQIKSSK